MKLPYLIKHIAKYLLPVPLLVGPLKAAGRIFVIFSPLKVTFFRSEQITHSGFVKKGLSPLSGKIRNPDSYNVDL